MLLFHEELRKHIGTASFLRADVRDVTVRADDTGNPAGEDPDIIFSGHAIVFDVLSDELGGRGWSFREKIARGAARKALDENQDVVYLYDHNGLVLARTSANTLELREDPRGLFVYARAAPTSLAKDLAMAMRAGNVQHMSFAFTTAEDTWEETYHEDGSVEAIRTVTKIDRLFDVSAVGQPAYPQTDAQVRSRDLNRVAQRYGLTPPDLPDSLDELAHRVASTAGPAHEARQAALLDQQAGAKRRLTVAQARTLTPRS
jgi:HK97 family phage prohead protease